MYWRPSPSTYDDRSMDPWELAYLPELVDADLLVPTRLNSLAGVPEDFGKHRWLRSHVAEWDRLEPITLHRELNWRTRARDQPWGRLYVGWSNGRHRVGIARDLGIDTLRIVVIGFAFWPPGDRPKDRRNVPRGESCFYHPDFDPRLARWNQVPDDERGSEATPCRPACSAFSSSGIGVFTVIPS